MLTCLLNNLQLMGILIAMYVGAFGANTLLGIYSNLAQAKEQFSKEKLIQGLIRGAIVLIGALLSRKKQLRFGTGTCLILSGVIYMAYLFVNL